jgi:hypothetical protein
MGHGRGVAWHISGPIEPDKKGWGVAPKNRQRLGSATGVRGDMRELVAATKGRIQLSMQFPLRLLHAEVVIFPATRFHEARVTCSAQVTLLRCDRGDRAHRPARQTDAT